MLPNQYNPETDPQEAARAAGTMLRTGTVVEVDTARALLRFKTGDITTDWLPWFETRAGGARGGRTWWPPIVGEQGMLIAPGGDLARAVVLPGMFSSAMPAGSEDADTMRIDFDEADRIEYQRGKHLRMKFGGTTITLAADAITMHAGGGTLTLDADGLRGEPDVVSGSVSLRNHKHVGVTPGPALTGPPA